MYSDPLAYFLTWHTYGTWLHGDEKGSIDSDHNQFGSDHIGHHPDRRERVLDRLKHAPLVLDQRARSIVRKAVTKHCDHRSWQLLACSVRSNHVHVVVNATTIKPEEVVRQFKQWGTRMLRRELIVESDRKVWADHASTKYLFDQANVDAAVRYTIESQDRTGDHLKNRKMRTD